MRGRIGTVLSDRLLRRRADLHRHAFDRLVAFEYRLGNRLCGEKGAEAYCYYANISVSLRESLADVETQTSTQALIETTIGWRPPVKNFSVSATGSVQGVAFADYPGGRQDVVLIGSGSLNWTPSEKLSFSAGASFTQQLSTQSDLDWNGWNAYPQAVLNLKFY